MSIRWITSLLGTAPAHEAANFIDVQIIDVRDLVDKSGNRPEEVREKIMIGVGYLEKNIKTIICCDYGISRSNAIASGILAVHNKITLEAAVRMVQEATGEMEIKLDPLQSVRKAIEGKAFHTKNITGKRTILVTGSSGFIGSAICKRLQEEFIVVSPSRENLDLEKGCTQLSLMVSESKVDCIIHLANPRIYTSNVGLGKTLAMLRNILEVCVAHDVSLIYPSSWEIYSGYSGSLLVDESIPAFPLGPYGETKHLAEMLINHWKSTTDIRCAVVRSSPVYGLGGTQPKFIYNFIEKAKNSKPIFTHRYLNGPPSLDLLNINDFADAIMRVCRQEYFGVLNLGTGIATSTIEIAERIKTIFNSPSVIMQIRIDSNTASISMNSHKAQTILNWAPKIALENGLSLLCGNTD